MDQNPYQPPVASASQSEPAEQPLKRGRRPLGIWILSGLHVLVGVLFLAAAIAVHVREIEIVDATGRLIVANWLLTLFLGTLATYATLSGVGMWRGDRWGWWLATSGYVWATLGAASGIPYVLWQMESLDGAHIAYYVLPRLVCMTIGVLLVLYFFKSSIRRFFGLQSLRMIPALAVLALISLVLFAVRTAVAYFQIGGER